MKARILIEAIVQQSTVLVAQMATSGGLRAPLAHIANEVFLDLSRALEAPGVSRKVGPDMFGMALRAYIRKGQRLEESTTGQGRSLWNAVYPFLKDSGVVTRDEVVRRFRLDDEMVVRSMLRDMSESGLVFVTGAGAQTSYRVLWAFVFSEGSGALERLQRLGGLPVRDIESTLERLVARGAIERDDSTGDGGQSVTEENRGE